MQLLSIHPTTEAYQLTGATTTELTGTTEERLAALTKLITDQKITGGVVDQEVVFTTEEGTFELSQYLTEKTNGAFIQGSLAEFAEKAARIPWEVTYHGLTPGKDEYSVESLLTVGNGFLGLRGTTPEMAISEATYPATYLASLYNTAASQVSDRTIYNEDFVNAPNLQKIYLVIDDEKINLADNQVDRLKRRLDLQTGLFESWSKVTSQSGKTVAIQTKKIASMASVHQYAISYTFTPLNFSGPVELVSEANGSIFNYNVARYRSLTKDHLDLANLEVDGSQALLVAKTKQSQITVAQESQLASESLDLTHLKNVTDDKHIWQSLTIEAVQGQSYDLTKTVQVNQYRKEDALPDFKLTSEIYPSFEALYADSQAAWQKLWDQAAIEITGDLMSQKMLNLHTYHILSSGSPKGNQNLDASITARGLHGEAYRGHIFWDELFILPFYIIHFPETAKELLMYRYRRLAAAKIDAEKAGHQGAMFPWQSGLDGTEQSQELHLNPISGEWKEDHSRLQRHVSLAIAYNVWNYFNNTQDSQFMADYGLELMLEIAHFWESISVWNEVEQRFDISGVMGPDEFHEAYPGSEKGGLKNNAYTNMMVVWLFEEIEKLQQELSSTVFSQVQEKTGLTDETLSRMSQIKNQLALAISPEGIIAQFDGYFDLKDLDWEHYRKEYGNIYRMDRILNAEGQSADEYKVAKQADSLMIYYNLPKAQVDGILADLDYSLPEDYVERNLNYYLERTSHGSTLSRVVHAQLAAMVDDQDLAWSLYKEALYSDYRDIQGGTTAEGIHAGVMAATLFIPLTTFAGMDIRQDVLGLTPKMPKAWDSIAFNLSLRGVAFKVKVDHQSVTILADQSVTINVADQAVSLVANQEQQITY